MFAAKFREAAARALLLPKRRPGGRSPLWQQRKRAADLLAVASKFGSFPMLLEAYRECLRDVFDMPALVETLKRIEQRQVKMVVVDSVIPSPFASALLFAYVANYIYDGDAPLAERRAQALAIDQAQLRELLGDVELRELLDADSLAEVELQAQQLDPAYQARSVDGVHDMLLRLGDLTVDEIAARSKLPARPADRGTGARATGHHDQHRQRAARPAGRIRRQIPGRARRAPPSWPAGVAASALGFGRERSRPALRSHARSVHDRGIRIALCARPQQRRQRC